MSPSKKKPKLSKEEIVLKKSIAAKARLMKIKSDPILLAQYKEKERLKYLKKKEKGQRKCIKDMTPREQRKTRKKWKTYSSDYRLNQKVNQAGKTYISQNTPPSSDDEISRKNEPPEPLNNDIGNRNLQVVRQIEAKKRSVRQRKSRNMLLKKKLSEITELKKNLNTQQKKYYRLKQKMKKVKKALTPKNKIYSMAEDPNQRKELVKKALFGEVLRTQITENYSKVTTSKEKSNFKKLLSGPTSEKYKLWRLDDNFITQKKLQGQRRRDFEGKRIARKNKIITTIQEFYEDDSISRNAAGKKECITRNKIKKQKRYLLDSLKNTHKKFLKTNPITIGYSLFCKLRPFWVVPPKLTDRDTCACIIHENIDLKLSSLKSAKVLKFENHQSALHILCCDRYSEECLFRQCNKCFFNTLPYDEFDNNEDISMAQWKHEKEMYKDPKTKKERFVSKYKKKNINIRPRDLIIELEETELLKLLKHEGNIVHQYQTLKSLKQSLTDKDTVIHMDFSENYATKCNQEIQSYHFGGSRIQISLHTVVVYTKDLTTAHCTISSNLAHDVAAIWAHLQPVLQSLPSSVENLHFLSDGPVTQYRNKTMFFILARKLQDWYPNTSFSWNYHEAGHGKGAPDGVGATCKRTADKIIAQKADITSLNEFVDILCENCPRIKISIIKDEDIEIMSNLIKEDVKDLQSFKGTLLVHQVTGGVYSPNKLILKSLSCFCNKDCEHYKLGSLEYKIKPARLRVSDVYTDSEDDMEPIQNTRDVEHVVQAGPSHNFKDKSKVIYGSGDYVLVKLCVKSKEYRYAAICSSYDDEEGELTLTFLKIHNEEENLFKIDENDVADVPYEDIIKKLPIPNLIVKGDRVFYKFKKAIDVFEK